MLRDSCREEEGEEKREVVEEEEEEGREENKLVKRKEIFEYKYSKTHPFESSLKLQNIFLNYGLTIYRLAIPNPGKYLHVMAGTGWLARDISSSNDQPDVPPTQFSGGHLRPPYYLSTVL